MIQTVNTIYEVNSKSREAALLYVTLTGSQNNASLVLECVYFKSNVEKIQRIQKRAIKFWIMGDAREVLPSGFVQKNMKKW